MNASTGKIRLRQAVGSFDEAGSLRDVVQVLADQDVAPSDLTVLVGQDCLEGKFLTPMRSDPGTMLDIAMASMNAIGMTESAGPLLVSSTPFGDLLIAAAAGMAETPQLFLTRWLSARHAGYLQEQLDAGAALLCIHVRNGEEEKRAGRALLRHSRHQVQMHDFSFPDEAPPAA
ncbi:MAG: hypothetical protein ACR2P3_01390 [Geminicoccaceae bacterium]